MLIKKDDITTLRNYVKVSFSASALKSMPDLESAEQTYLIPVLTQPVYDQLQEQVTTDAVTWTTLLNLCRAVVAPLAYYVDLPFIQASIEDGGLKTTNTEHKQAAHQWEYNKVETALLNKGTAALEVLILHLLSKGVDYTWENADVKNFLITTGIEFSSYIHLHQPNVTFQQLKPVMLEVQDHFVCATIGEEYFVELKNKSNPSDEEKKAIKLLKKSVAHFTIARAVDRLPVKITPQGLMASLQENSEASNPMRQAGDAQLLGLQERCLKDAENYLRELRTYLNKNASQTLFQTYFESEHYKDPSTKKKNINDCLTGFVAM